MASKSNVQLKVQALEAAVCQRALERDSFVHCSMLALLARKNLFVLGTFGTGKSYAVEMICKAFTGIDYFEYLLGGFTKPEELFGPYDISQLKGSALNEIARLQFDIALAKQDWKHAEALLTGATGSGKSRYIRIVEDRLFAAHVAFLDETWKGNSSILNDLLRISDETRRFYNPKPQRAPLISLFGASNELPQEDVLKAMYDRFHFRIVVKSIADSNNFITMLRNKLGKNQLPPIPQLSLVDLQAAQAETDKVNFPDSVLQTISTLRNTLNDRGFAFSERRWNESLAILQANAWLAGRSAVNGDDIATYCDLLWYKPDERKDVCTLILSVTNPEMVRANELMDLAQTAFDEAFKQRSTAAGHEACDKMREALKELKTLNQSDRLKEISGKITEMKRRVYDEVVDV
jgi:MoxR-like ATPase